MRILHNKYLLSISYLLIFIIVLAISCNGEEIKIVEKNDKPMIKVLLLGASVGKAWNFEGLSQRLHNNLFTYEFIAKYQPDKTDILEQALNRKEKRPDAIIIKQCAAYFRSDSKTYKPLHVQRYKQLIEEWVLKCTDKNVVPILATVVPITEKTPLMVRMKRLIKKYILFKNISPYYRDVRLKGILDYNDWLKVYAEKNRLIVLDLDAAVRISNENRYLNPDLSTDGLHLNDNAYKQLDHIASGVLTKVAENCNAVRNNEY